MELLLAQPRATWPLCLACTQHLSRIQSFVAILLALLYAGVAVGASNTTKYMYDAAGNITQIQRLTAAGFAITSFDPAFGSVGTVVTIYGTGFSTTPASNAVAFNGVAAVVTASDAGSISTTVPAGATTGRITVTVNGVTATSASDFIVTVPGAPVITGFAPASGVAGDTITLSGSNFDASTTVKLNGMAVVATVIDSTQLTFKVPSGTSSGKIVASNSSGSATTVNDFIVPPPGLLVGDIVTSVRLQVDAGNRNLAIGTSGKSGLALFDASPGVSYSIQLVMEPSPTNAVVPYKVIKPDNTVLLSGSVGGNNYPPSIHLPTLSVAGTYSLLLSPGPSTLNVNVRIETDPVLVVDGPAVASSLDALFQSARYVFDATANQHIGIGLSHLTFVVAPAYAGNNGARLHIFRPDGVEIAAMVDCTGVVPGNPGGNCDTEFVAPVTGRYTATFDDWFYDFGQYSVMLNSEVTGTLLPDASQTVSLGRPGQDARFTFAASAGDSFGLDVAAISLQPQAGDLYITIYKPDGTVYKYCSATQSRASYCDLGTLATAGIYTIAVDPANGGFGTFALTLKQGAMLGTSDPPLAFATVGVMESARFRFSGTAGQNLSVGISALATGASNGYAGLIVYAPNGTSLYSGSWSCYVAQWDGCRASITNLPQSGIYSAVLQPVTGVNVSGNVNLSQELTGTLQPGVPEDLSARSGQLARYTFAGVAGDSTSIKLLGVSTTPASNISAYVSVLQPSGALVGSASASGASPAAFINLGSLPASGTYTVTIDPGQGGAWQGRLLLDPGAPIVIDGDSVSSPTGAPGETLRYTFMGTSGQRIDIGMAGLAYAPASTSLTLLTVYNPAGGNVASFYCYTSSVSCKSYIPSAPATGKYTLAVAPSTAVSITGGTLTLSTPLAGTLNVGDPAQVIAISRTGQIARYTFSGTAGQLLRVNWSGASLNPAPGIYISVTVLKPDGTTLSSGSFSNGSTSGFDVAALPTSGTYTVVFDPTQGVTMSASVSLVTR